MSGCCRLHLIGDRPNKPRQFPRDRGGYHRGQLSGPGKLAVPAAQSFLRFPCNVADRLGELFLPDQLCAADPGREPVTPGGLDQHPPRRLIASLCDTALATLATAGVLGWNQAKICHELAWLGEAGDVAQFSNQCCRRHHGHAAQCLERLHDWCERPSRQRRLDMRLQTIASGGRRIHGFEAILEHDVMYRVA